MVWDARIRLDAGQLPVELEAAIRSDVRARERFDSLSVTQQREYARWVADGRRAEIRERRAAQTVMRLLSAGMPAADRASTTAPN